jgi:3-deoxy-D-manno-octulosonic-acid transferase
MTLRAVLALYNALLPFGLLLTAPMYLAKMVRRGNYGRDFGQRFGFYSAAARARLGPLAPRPVWVQAVSVGEVLVALKFIRALRNRFPEQPVVLSCTTSTAHELARTRAGDACSVVYHPLDLPGPVAAAFDLLRPRLLVLVEAELWPNLLARAAADGVPVVLVNARLSPRSERRYRQFPALVRPLFAQLRQVHVQAPEDADRWIALGVVPEHARCPGSIKFDQDAQPYPEAQIARFRELLSRIRGARSGPVILAGSTHPGEERLVATAFREMRRRCPDAFLVLVPRHFERGAEVVREVRACGFDPVRKTDLDAPGATWPEPDPERCLVVDTTGELWAWYHLADVVLVGKTFLSDEGQNPIEPILAGKPVVTGPEMKNFATLADRLWSVDGAVRVQTPAELPDALLRLLEDPDRAARIVAAGRTVVARDQGAAARSAEALAEFLEPTAARPGTA